MSNEKTYNGWKNRTTWNIMLWLDNDEPTYRAYQSQVKEWKAQGKTIKPGMARELAKSALGDSTPDGCSLNSPGVDWKAIAEAMAE